MITNTDQERLTKYFQHEGITKEVLDFFNVKVSKSDKDEVQLEYPYYDGNVKLCRPFSEAKWSWKSGFKANNKPNVFGLDVLPTNRNYLFITAGQKDVMSLYALGLSAICFNSESTGMDEKLLRNLKTRFRDVIILFDNDDAGKKYSVTYGTKYDLPYVKWPKEMIGKDVTDFVANGGTKNKIGELTNSAIQRMLKSFTQLSCKDLMRIESQEEDYIIKDLIPSNNIIGIIGASDTGKSLLSLQFVICYLLNKPFLNQEVKGGKKVVICSYEDGTVSLKKRISNLTQNLSQKELQSIHDKLTFILYSENNIEGIQEYLNTHPETGLIVIDPFSELMVGKDLNSSGDVRAVMKSIYNLCLENNLAVAYIHHNTKASDKEGALGKGNSSGSQAIEAKTRVLFELNVTNNQRVLGIIKGNDIPIDMKYPNTRTILEFEDGGSLWFKKSESKFLVRKARPDKTKIKWEEVFDDANELKYGKIVEKLVKLYDIHPNTAARRIKSELYQISKGLYCLPSDEEDFEL